jgi:hypothetical protein
MFLFVTTYRLLLRPIQPPIKLILQPLFTEVKKQEHETENSLPSSAEVKNTYSHTSTPP